MTDPLVLLLAALLILALVAVSYLLGTRKRADSSDEIANKFKVLAAEILDDRSRRFAEQNQQAMTHLLAPLQSELSGFRKKVEEVYHGESVDRGALREQLRILTELNGTLREETTSLTQALKGDSKAQGDWGEVILERLLESAGLLEGTHFTRQSSMRDAAGERVIPDVVLHLPNARQMVVDSKVTLTAYTAYSSATDDASRAVALKAHLDSVRRHIKSLSAKNYQELYGVESLDCVVMFLPLEGAFLTAVSSDQELWRDAWERNVLLVSPSTLLFVVRTVAHVWRQESQSRNAQEIAQRGAELYDKFAGFATDLEKVGELLARTSAAHEEARKKLTTGRGNLVRQVEMLRELGVRPTKELPSTLSASAEEMD